MSEGMIPRPRRLTSGVFKYRTTPTGFLPTDADLERTLRTGVGGTSMPSFSHLSQREITSVIAYVKTLSSRWRRWFEDAAERARHAAAGAAVFGRLCVPCHGAAAAGDGPSAGSLEDVWGDRVRPADLRQPLARSGPGWGDLYRTITTGLDGTPMMGFAEVTTPEERWELVAFIREQRKDVDPLTRRKFMNRRVGARGLQSMR
jgi:cytochrome c oxidase cbb3-type subunit 2